MRLLLPITLVLFVGPAAWAEDPPEGSIGIIISQDGDKVVVIEPVKDGPAEKAGIKANDVVVKVDDFKAEDKDATAKEIVKHKPGEKIKVTVNRDGKDMVIEVTVGKRSEIFPKK